MILGIRKYSGFFFIISKVITCYEEFDLLISRTHYSYRKIPLKKCMYVELIFGEVFVIELNV